MVVGKLNNIGKKINKKGLPLYMIRHAQGQAPWQVFVRHSENEEKY